jgi:serine/threonine-protein kinase
VELPIPPELDAIVMKCLEKDPEDRYPSIDALEEALETVPDPEPWTRRRAARWWDLHMVEDEIVRDCFCPPVENLVHDSGNRAEFSTAAAGATD